MKPNKRKIAAACRAMKRVGITVATTTKAVKELLEIYDNSWKFIEEDSYKLLLDVLLPDEAGVTSTNRGASSKVKTEVELQRQEEKHASMSLESNPSGRQHQNDGVFFSYSGVSQASLRRIRPKSQANGVFVNDSEKVRCKNKEGPSVHHTAVEVPTKRLYTRQQKKQASSPFKLCSATTPSRKPHWTNAGLSTASEESCSSDSEEYQPLLKRTSLKGKEKVMISLSSDSDECQPLLKRTSLRGKEKVVISCFSDSEESQPLLKRTCLRSKEEVMICNSKGVVMNNVQIPSNVQTKVVELPTSKTYPSQKKKQALSLPKSCMETMSSITAHLDCEESEDSPILFTRKKKRTFVPADSLVSGGSRPAASPKSCMERISSSMAHLDDGILVSDCKESKDFPTVFARKKRRFVPTDNLVSGSPRPAESPTVIHIDDSSDSDGCNVDEKISELTEVKPSIVYKRKSVSGLPQMDIVDEDSLDFHEVKPSILDTRDCVLDSFMMDVVPSPPKQKLNSSLICNSSPESDFYSPNMEMMDQRCGESYRNEECVLKTESHSIIDEIVRFRDPLQLKSSNSSNVIAMKDDPPSNNACPLSFPSEKFVFKNLIKIVPHIPRGIVFCRFGCLHSLAGFPVKESDYICDMVGKRLNVLPALQPSISYEVEATQSHHYSHAVVKSCLSFEDITRGNEKVMISLEDDGRNVEDLLNVCYIWQNVVYKKADVKFALNRISEQSCCSQCFGNCLASPVPCGCAIQTGGGFAYTPGGLVKGKFLEKCILETRQPKDNYFYCKECPLAKSKNKRSSKPCKGHLLRRFIKECWYKCGCIKNCGNRIVQQGISVKLQVFLTPEGKGWGLRVLEDLPKGSFVCQYIGEILTLTELRERNTQSAGKKHTYTVLLDGSWRSECVNDEEALCLDATYCGNVARFINHRCFDASLIQIPVEVETPNRHYYHVALFTTRNVAAMEELTWDYGINFNDLDHPVKPFKCLCRSPYCRGSDFEVQH